MRRDKVYIILFAILSVLLFAPMLQKALKIIRIRPLNGVTVEKPMPKFSVHDYYNGTFQKKTEEHIQQSFGFRPLVVRLYNQFLWDFYKKTFVGVGQIVFGKEDWIYEPWFVEDYYQSNSYHHAKDSLEMAKKFDAEAKRIFQLQNILNSYGTDLFFCQLPGKDLIYPEYLPENVKYFKEKKISARDYYDLKFDELGINHINIEQWFLQMKDTADFLLFPQTGTHWSNMASIYAADSILRYMEKLKDVNLHNLIISDIHIGRPRKPDDDLESLMNLIRPLKKSPLHYAKVTTDDDKTALMPRIITVGDSYYWNIANQVPLKEIFYSSPYWYYNSTIYFDMPHKTVDDVDIVEELLSSDYVMLSYCSTQLYTMCDNFTQKALLSLCYNPEEIQAQKDKLKKKYQSNEKKMKVFNQRAEKSNISIDSVIDEEVETVILSKPELFFPALKDTIPLRRSRAAKTYFHNDSIRKVNIMIDEIMDEMKSSPEKMKKIEAKAKAKNIDIETAIRNDAIWVAKKKIYSGKTKINQKISRGNG